MALHAHFQRRFALVVSVLLLTVTITACGSNTSRTTSTGSTGTVPSTPTIAGTSSQGSGCPSHDVVTTPPPPPSVLVTPSKKQLYAAHIGDTIEVDLPIGTTWNGPIDLGSGLQMQKPAGYTWGKACVWRFVAHAAGTTQLTFVGRVMCKQRVPCLLAESAENFTVVVK